MRMCIDNRHWQVEKYYLILMTLLVRAAYPPCGTGSKRAG